MQITHRQLRRLIKEALEGHPSPAARPGDDPEILDALAVRDGPSPFAPELVSALDKVDVELTDDVMSSNDYLEMSEYGDVALAVSEEEFEDMFQVKIAQSNSALAIAIEELYDDHAVDWENHMVERINAYWIILQHNVENDKDLQSNMQTDYAENEELSRDPYGARGLKRSDFY